MPRLLPLALMALLLCACGRSAPTNYYLLEAAPVSTGAAVSYTHLTLPTNREV